MIGFPSSYEIVSCGVVPWDGQGGAVMAEMCSQRQQVMVDRNVGTRKTLEEIL